MWFHPWRAAEEARIRLIAREADLAARLASAETDLALARAEAADLRRKIERLLDNTLYASGLGPIFAPEDARFQTRPPAEPTGLARLRQPTSPVRWRMRAEQETLELAREQERRQWQQDLERIKREAARTATEPAPASP